MSCPSSYSNYVRRGDATKAADYLQSLADQRFNTMMSDAVAQAEKDATAIAQRVEQQLRRALDAPELPQEPTALGVAARFLRTSTCTTFDRPWLKLCRTEPASTVRPNSNRPAGRRESRVLPPS